MHNHLQHTLLWLKRFLFVLFFYFVSRLFFYLVNLGYFSDINLPALLRCFTYGVRFDIASIIFTNLIFILFLFPGKYKDNTYVIKLSGVLFAVINSAAMLMNFADARFFDFINKRSSSAVFVLMKSNEDVWMMLPSIIKDYWYILLSWIITVAAFIKWMPRIDRDKFLKEKSTIKGFLMQLAVFIFIPGLMLLGGRGIKLKPIGLADAASGTELKYVPLVLNTPFSVIKSMGNENLDEVKYFKGDDAARIYTPMHYAHTGRPFRNKNVVIFILESFSKEYCGYLGGLQGFTPNLDSILRQSLVFPNAYANGTQSYEAMAAILAGIPSLMERPYGGSNYADNMIESLPGLLAEKGYTSSFFHGGNNGTMGFENFARIAGVSHYYGRNEYNNDADYDGHWGIWDEQFLQYFKNQIDTFRQPFMTAVFTLSSHHPYSIPPQYSGKFREGSVPVLRTIAYADFALGKFFRAARNTDWYTNTVFVFTADHAAQAVNSEFNSTTGMFAIPIAFFCPTDTLLRGTNQKICQQIDIMPSVLDYLNFDRNFFSFGKSVFDTTARHTSVSYVNGIYQLIEDNYVMQFDGNQVTGFSAINERVTAEKAMELPGSREIYQNMENEIKAVIETYNYCLINNRTTIQQNMQATMQIPFEIRSKQLP